MLIFIFSATLTFCYKITCVALVSYANEPILSVSISYIPLYVCTHVSVLQILLKNMNIAWYWGSRDFHVQTGSILPTRVSVLEHQRTDCDKLQTPQWVNMDARYV